jgi:ABC-type uncharacterized transport system auxiliary subunit
MKKALAPVFLLPFLAGCLGSAPPVPRDHYYRLLVSAPTQIRADEQFAGVMRVELFQADGLLRERPLLFSGSGASHEVQQHDYHYWTDAPPRMLQEQLVAYLRRSGVARSVITPDLRVRADYQVTGKVKRLERLLGGGPPRVFVEIELALVRLSDSSLILIDNFVEQEPDKSDSVESAITALNRATGRLFGRFVAKAVGAISPMAGRSLPPGGTTRTGIRR